MTIELRHGYTLNDVDRMARQAVKLAGPFACDIADRVDAARFSIIEALYVATEAPPGYDLIRVGRQAIHRLVNNERHHHGQVNAGPTAPRFAAYWNEALTVTSCEDAVVERLALAQILTTLSAHYRQALVALAACDDYEPAAAVLALRPGTLRQRITMARRQFRSLWHEGEAPSGVWSRDVRTRKGQRRVGGRRTMVLMRRRAAARRG